MMEEAVGIDLPGDVLTRKRRKRADTATGIVTIALLITAIAMADGIMAMDTKVAVSATAMAVRPVGHTAIKCKRYTNGEEENYKQTGAVWHSLLLR
jgi:hypothetical protein